jgi:hypothetical protein
MGNAWKPFLNDVDFSTSTRHVAGGARATVGGFWSPEPVLAAPRAAVQRVATNHKGIASPAPDSGGATLQCRGAYDERSPLVR